MDVTRDVTDSAQTVAVVTDVDAMETVVMVSEAAAACGSSFCSAAVVDSVTDVDVAIMAVAMTAACGSSSFSAAVADSAMAADSVMDVDVATAADVAMAVAADIPHIFTFKRRHLFRLFFAAMHTRCPFFIYIYNADPGRSHHGRKAFKTNDTI